MNLGHYRFTWFDGRSTQLLCLNVLTIKFTVATTFRGNKRKYENTSSLSLWHLRLSMTDAKSSMLAWCSTCNDLLQAEEQENYDKYAYDCFLVLIWSKLELVGYLRFIHTYIPVFSPSMLSDVHSLSPSSSHHYPKYGMSTAAVTSNLSFTLASFPLVTV